MKRIAHFFRLIHIQYILAKHGIDQLVFSTRRFNPFWFLTFLNPWNWFRPPIENPGIAIRKALEELGPIFVKFGQVLSTRRDLLPDNIIRALTSLQDNVPPFSTQEARAIIEKNLNQPIEKIFLTFDDVPLAAASIAQVHAATLFNGKSVVVKILRPNIRKKIQQDIDLLYTLAELGEYSPTIRRLKPKAVIREFEVNLLDEIDLKQEAGNASKLRRNFAHYPQLYIPQIEWEYTTSQIMVMERISGIPIADRKALEGHQINLKKLAERSIDIFFTQVFRHAFFHADMHPGNIFVSTQNPQDPQYICVDFGIMGTLSDKDKRYIAENLHAFFHRDYRRVAQLHIESGWVNADIRVERFESAIRALSEPIFEKPLKEISFADVLFNLIQTARRFHINIQPQLILLQKTLLAIEGLGRYLYPDLDLWATAKPFLEKWIREQVGIKAFARNIRKQLPFISEHLPEIPQLLHTFLLQNNAQNNAMQIHLSDISSHREKKSRSSMRSILFSMGIGIILGGLSMYAFLLF